MNDNMKIKYFDEELEVYDERRVVNKNTYSITLNYVPSPTRPLTVENGRTILTETNGTPNANQYVLDRENGLLLFNQAMKGKVMTINYSAIGLWCISADKVYTNVDNKGKIVETLEDLMRENRQAIESIKTIGDASTVITQLQANIDSVTGLVGNIAEGSSVNEELAKSITSGKGTNTTLTNTISSANNKINEMNTWVNQHGDIVNLDNRVDTVETEIPKINEQLDTIAYLCDETIEDFTSILPTQTYTLQLIRGNYNVDNLNISRECCIDLNGSVLIMTNKDKNLFTSLGNKVKIKNGTIKTNYDNETIYRYTGNGVYLSGDDIILDNITFDGCGLIVYHAKRPTVKNCNVNAKFNIIDYGIQFCACDDIRCYNNNIDGFNVDGIKTSSLNLDKSPTGVVEKGTTGFIKNNIIRNCKDDGIDIYDCGRKMVIAENIIENCKNGINIKSQNSTGNLPETVGWAEESIVAFNIIENCEQFMQIGGNNYSIIGNRMKRDRTISTTRNGVTIGVDSLYPTVHNILFANNVIEGSANIGLWVGQFAKNIELNSNIIKDSGDIGLKIEKGCTVNGGQIIDCYGDRYVNVSSGDNNVSINGLTIENLNSSCAVGIRISNAESCSVVGCVSRNIATPYRDDVGVGQQNCNSWLGRMQGDTTNRPSRTTYDRGTTYYDTTLRKMLTWSGFAWLDSMGTAV